MKIGRKQTLARAAAEGEVEEEGSGLSLLQHSCEQGQLDMVRELLQHAGINVNAANGAGGRSALIVATLAQLSGAVELLLGHPDIDVNSADTEGCTGLHYAATSSSLESLGALLRDPRLDVNVHNNGGDSAPLWACRTGTAEAMAELLGHPGIDVNALNGIEYGFGDGGTRKTALMVAASLPNLRKLDMLLQHPAIDPGIQDSAGDTCLSLAAASEAKNGLKVVQKLLGHPRIGASINAGNRQRQTALHLACCRGDVDVIRCILQHADCDANVTHGGSETALQLVCDRGDLEIISCMLQLAKVDVNAVDGAGGTALHHACRQGKQQVTLRILQHPAVNINAPDKQLRTPLMTACDHGNTAAVALLLKRTAIRINAVDVLEQSALMVAAVSRAHGAVAALLGHKGASHGASPIQVNLADRDGNTALHLACQHNHACIVNELLGWKGISVVAKNKAKEDAYDIATQL